MQEKSQKTFMTFLHEKQEDWQEKQREVLLQHTGSVEGRNGATKHFTKDRILIKAPPPFSKPSPKRTIDSYKAYALGMTNDSTQHFLGLEHLLQGDALVTYNTFRILNPDSKSLLEVSDFLLKHCKLSPTEIGATYDTRKQGIEESVSDYTRDMRFLMAKGEVPSVMQKQAFINNLTEHIRDIVKEKEPDNLEDAVKIALDAELTLKAQEKKFKVQTTKQDEKIEKLTDLLNTLTVRAVRQDASVEALYLQDRDSNHWGPRSSNTENCARPQGRQWNDRRSFPHANRSRGNYRYRPNPGSDVARYDTDRKGRSLTQQRHGDRPRSYTPHPQTRFTGERRQYQPGFPT